MAAAALAAAAKRDAHDARLRAQPPPRELEGKSAAAAEYWLRHKPGYGVAPQFCASSVVATATMALSATATTKAKNATTNATTTPTATTPLPDSERLDLLARAKARRAALSAQKARLPLCFAADTPSGLRRREALGRALDQARRDVDALERAGQVVVVVAAGAGAAAEKSVARARV